MFSFLRRNQEGAAAVDMPIVSGVAAGDGQVSWWSGRVVHIVLYLLLFFTPLLSLPYTQDALLAKVGFVEIAAVILAVAWLLNIFTTKRIAYKRNPWNIGFLALALSLIASNVLSASAWGSFWGNDATGEKTASVLAFIVIAWVAAAVLKRDEVERMSAVLLSSFGLLGLYALAAFIGNSFGTVPAWLTINPIGTVNALAYVLGCGFLLSLGIVLGRVTPGGRALLGTWIYRVALACGIILFLCLILIGFQILWIAIAIITAVMLAFHFTKSWNREGEKEQAFTSTAVAFGCMVLVASVFLAFKSTPLAGQIYQPPVEVSPSLLATLAIDRAVLAVQPVVGFGPSNFVSAFNRFRDPGLNQTDFWTARFNHGYSLVSTLPATVGALGIVGYLAFIVLVVMILGRAALRSDDPDPLLLAWGGVVFFVLLMWFLYAGNFTATFLLFAALGLVGAALKEPLAPGADGETRLPWWKAVGRRTIIVDSALLNFVTALVVVFAAALSLVAIWGLSAQYVAEAYFLRAATVMNQFGNVDTAKIFLDRAVSLNPTESSYYQGKAQVGFVAISRLIQQAQANPSADIATQFRDEFSKAVSAGQRSTVLAGDNPQNWFVLGQLYEVVIPFVAGADTAALESYRKAREFDPPNPALAFALGRMHLTVGDLLNLQVSQTTSGEERSKIEAARNDAMTQARDALQESANLKPDYAQAHYLLAQVAIRENNLAEAVKRTEATLVLAPNDVGVAFQLGVLYYTGGNFDGAKDAFNRAVALNDNYSNARYFLGLIWDRKGDRSASLSQFQKILALNPDNEEVEKIIANIERGKPALDGIVPPLQAPEKRTEAPVKEKGEGSKPLERPTP